MEKTLILLKPDALQRGLIGEITHRFEAKGLKLVGLKMISVDDTLLEVHYAHIKVKPFFEGMKSYMKSSPIVCMVWEGLEAVLQVRTLVGALHPKDSVPGTIRADFAMTLPSNLVHASVTVKEAGEEVARFFKEDEIFDYQRPFDANIYAEDERS